MKDGGLIISAYISVYSRVRVEAHVHSYGVVV